MIVSGTIDQQTAVDLRRYIEVLRKKLIKVGLQYGLSSKEAITISQELDHYLSICQKCCPRGCNQ